MFLIFFNQLYGQYLEEVTTLFVKYSIPDIANRYFGANKDAKEQFLKIFDKAYLTDAILNLGSPLCG